MNNLNKLSKNDLLTIISKMKKTELVKIINNKIGGADEVVIKETQNAVRKSIVFNRSKLNKKVNNAMANDEIYRKVIEYNNK
jgi:Mg/Co/Ni transporter MgtE